MNLFIKIKKYSGSIILLFVILSFFFPSQKVSAFSLSTGKYWEDIKKIASTTKSAVDCSIPKADNDAVPIKSSDIEREAAARYKEKEIGNCKQISFNGKNKKINFGSWDYLFTQVGKIAIRSITKELVNWIGGGTDKAPAFVTDPGQFFADIADKTAGEYIAGSDLEFLCSPLDTDIIRKSLKINFNTSRGIYNDRPTQCTISGIGGNLENFYNDFSQGGFGAWFEMTQNPDNNPYGIYMKADMELNRRIANAVGIEEKMLDWGNGFFSNRECLKFAETTPNSASSGSPECLQYGPIKTPGVFIEDYLAETSGTWVRQLELADELDEIVNAALGALSNKILKSGLNNFDFNSAFEEAGGDEPDEIAPEDPVEPMTLSCSSNLETSVVGQNVIWTAQLSNSTITNPVFVWSGDEISGVGRVKSVTYSNMGTKTASVTSVVDGVEQTVPCGIVTVTNFAPLSVSCSPEVNFSRQNTPITWIAAIAGGSGELRNVEWISVDTNENNWTPNRISLNGGSFRYEADNRYPTDGEKFSAISVTDADSTVPFVQNQLCSESVLINESGSVPTQTQQ